MAYLGRAVDSGSISNIENLDNISFDGSSSYSLTKNSVAFVPASASNLLISIDGVVNATNFTVSGSTIDFGVAVSSSSVCNFIIHLGVGIVTTPSDGSVGVSQLATNSISTVKIQDNAVTYAKSTGFGKLAQVKFNDTTTSTTIGSSSFTDLGLSHTITPTNTSSGIFITFGVHGEINHNRGFRCQVVRTIGATSTNVLTETNEKHTYFNSNVSNARARLTHTSQVFDTNPSTTSEITYKIQVQTDGGQNVAFNLNTGRSFISLMEILG